MHPAGTSSARARRIGNTVDTIGTTGTTGRPFLAQQEYERHLIGHHGSSCDCHPERPSPKQPDSPQWLALCARRHIGSSAYLRYASHPSRPAGGILRRRP